MDFEVALETLRVKECNKLMGMKVALSCKFKISIENGKVTYSITPEII
jgi:5-enolpyruvylshikimate-3-phosphate synthase